jgi:hypothetical protein
MKRDAWLFLTPEMEREAPALLAQLGAPGGAATLRMERLVHGGDARAWFAYLRECRAVLERSGRRSRAAAHRLALVLREQYLLAPGVPGLSEQDERELHRLQQIIEEDLWTSP